MAHSGQHCTTGAGRACGKGDLCSKGSADCKQVSAAFLESRIISDAIEHSPKELLKVCYEGKLAVVPGKELAPVQVIKQPTVQWSARSDQLYTLVELDLDAPSATDSSLRSVLHWLIYNIPGENLTQGHEYASYMGSAPFPNSGLHRYVFLVFPQTASFKIPPLIATPDFSERLRFDIKNFVRQRNLGPPLAGNFYVAQADAYATEFWNKRNA